MMIMSTGHISKETASLLDADSVGVVVYPKDGYGWFIVVTDWKDGDISIIPEDLRQCLSYAEENGCDWLCLDCGGTQYPDIPIYNWNN